MRVESRVQQAMLLFPPCAGVSACLPTSYSSVPWEPLCVARLCRWALEATFEKNMHSLMRAARKIKAVNLFQVRRRASLAPRHPAARPSRCRAPSRPLRCVRACVCVRVCVLVCVGGHASPPSPHSLLLILRAVVTPGSLFGPRQYFDKAYQSSNAEGFSTYVGVHELCHLTSENPCEVGCAWLPSRRVEGGPANTPAALPFELARARTYCADCRRMREPWAPRCTHRLRTALVLCPPFRIPCCRRAPTPRTCAWHRRPWSPTTSLRCAPRAAARTRMRIHA